MERDPQHVLIVDDDEATSSYVDAFLKRDYRVSCAADASQAMHLIARDCPDLVILDHYLPDMSGEDFLGRLRRLGRTRQLPVIVLTQDASPARFRACMELGADDFLTKPVRPGELAEAVAVQLRKYRQRHRAARIVGLPRGYRVIGTLGKGDSAYVYLARHPASGRDCVVKVIDLAPGLDQELVERFSREGRLLERISHPNVVGIFEHGIEEGQAYLAMEHIGGGTLQRRLGKPWELHEALRMAIALAQGLDAVHTADVIHRDVKPDNILLRQGTLDPVLLDFGAAKDLLSDQHLTAAGTILGTPSHMAPEIIEGDPALPASDVYAAGVIFYELLTGTRPYAAGNATELLHLHLTAPIPQPDHLPAAVQAVLGQLLAKSPLDRPRNGAAMARVLTRLTQRLTQ